MKTVFVVILENYEYLYIASTRKVADKPVREYVKKYPKQKLVIYEEKLYEKT